MYNYFLSLTGRIKLYIEDGSLISGIPATIYAIQNNILIDNQPALLWASKRLAEELEQNEPDNIRINKIIKSGVNPIGIRLRNGETAISLMIRKDVYVFINNQSVKEWATNTFNSLFNENGQLTVGTLQYALEFLAIKELDLCINKKRFLIKAAIFANKKIGLDTAIDFALKTNIQLDSKDPRIWAIDNKLEIKNELKISVLTEYFRDRTIVLESSFSPLSQKSGNSSGYIGAEKTTSAIHMIKYAMGASSIRVHQELLLTQSFFKRLTIQAQTVIKRSPYNYDTMCFINEFITSPIYKRILYNRTPQVSLINGDIPTEDKRRIDSSIRNALSDYRITPQYTINASRDDGTNAFNLLRSKYLRNFESLLTYQFTRLKDENVTGTEKVIAASLFSGELDINPGNIGVMIDNYGANVLAKIDHGWSGTRSFSNAGKMIVGLGNALITYKYIGAFTINPKSLKVAVDEILKISNEEIENLITSRIYELKHSNVDIRGLNFAYWHNDTVHNHEKSPHRNLNFSHLNELKKYFIEFYKIQKTTMTTLSERLDIISRIETQYPHANQKFHEGNWIFAIGEEDPMRWATRNRCKFDGVELYYQ